MNVELKAVSLEEKETLSNLPEKYFYELSQYELFAFREDGLFGYDPLDWYWTEEGRAAYFIRAEGRLEGDLHPVSGALADHVPPQEYQRSGLLAPDGGKRRQRSGGAGGGGEAL